MKGRKIALLLAVVAAVGGRLGIANIPGYESFDVSGRTLNIIAAVLGMIAPLLTALLALISQPPAADVGRLFGCFAAGGCGVARSVAPLKCNYRGCRARCHCHARGPAPA